MIPSLQVPGAVGFLSTIIFLMFFLLIFRKRILYALPIPRIILIPISGTIGAAGFETRKLVEFLYGIADDWRVKGVIFELDSPGGSAQASQLIYSAVKNLVKKKKLVVASVSGIAASGAYYVGSAANKIFASETSMVGSIGVLSVLVTAKELFERVGVKLDTFKRGEFKDTGLPHKELTDKEREYYQETVDEIYKYFLRDVSETRELTDEQLKEIKTGKVFTGAKGKELGLVDEFGSIHDAIKFTRKKVGKYRIFEMTPQKPKFSLFEGMNKVIGRAISQYLDRWFEQLRVPRF